MNKYIEKYIEKNDIHPRNKYLNLSFEKWYNNYHIYLYNEAMISFIKNKVGGYILFENLFSNEKFFNGIHDYMTRVDWTWFQTHNIPSIFELKNCVLDLAISSFDYDGNYDSTGISSGGFEVNYIPNHLLNVKFNENHPYNNVLFEVEYNIVDIRREKLKKLCC